MQLLIFSSFLLLGILASLLSSGSCATSLRSQSSTTPLPGRRERLPYTPVRNSNRQERLPYTPVKATTKRPSPSIRTIPTRRIPFPSRTTITPCNCKCDVTVYKPLCAGDGKEMDTFPNPCQLECYNCTLNKRYHVIKQGEC